jgi:methyl-accepting chemotaxis protein
VKRLTLSLKIILSFSAVVIAAIVTIIMILAAANNHMARRDKMWPLGWNFGFQAARQSYFSQKLSPSSPKAFKDGALITNLKLDPRLDDPINQSQEALDKLSSLALEFELSSHELDKLRSAFRASILAIALSEEPIEVKRELSNILNQALALAEPGDFDYNKFTIFRENLSQFIVNHSPLKSSLAALNQLDQSAQSLAQSLASLDELIVRSQKLSEPLSLGPPSDLNSADFFSPSKLGQLIFLFFFLIFLAVILIFLLNRSVINPLSRVMAWLNQSAEDVANTAQSLSSSSRSLAHGASDNTKAVLDAISSLEVLLGASRRNAGHAVEAKELIDKAKGYVDDANSSMTEISLAMEEIKNSGQASSQIIKSVEEISFQTKILSLNAAVEAARAGEAGVGFAVVADEVRNLANSSAEAAKNTASMLDSSIKRINDGALLVNKAVQSFVCLVDASVRAASLMKVIAEDSQNQSRDIQDVHQAIAMVDKVTQENAAEAAETENISNELNRQAKFLNSTISHLSSVVTGGAESQWPAKADIAERSIIKKEEIETKDQHAHSQAEAPKAPIKSAFGRASQKKLEQALPMDDDF